MRAFPLAFVALLLLVAGCSGTAPGGWERPEDQSASRAADMSRCREDARQIGLTRYPDQILRSSDGSEHRISNPDRFSAELSLFDQCMMRLGYRRAEAPGTRM